MAFAPLRTSRMKVEDALGTNEKIGIKRLDHVCWAVRHIDDVLPLLTGLMGMRAAGRFQNDEAGYRGVGLDVPGGGQIEVLEPLNEDGFLARFLRDRGPGLHHVTFEVEDVDQAAQAIRDFGIEPFGGVQRSHGWAETYIHPKDSGGVLFQFFTEEGPHDHEHESDIVADIREMREERQRELDRALGRTPAPE